MAASSRLLGSAAPGNAPSAWHPTNLADLRIVWIWPVDDATICGVMSGASCRGDGMHSPAFV